MDTKTACSTLRDQMVNYMKAFRATSLYRRDHPSGDKMTSMMHMCAEVARECHSQLASIIADTDQRYHTLRRINGMTTCILLIGTPVLSFIIAGVIYRKTALFRQSAPLDSSD